MINSLDLSKYPDYGEKVDNQIGRDKTKEILNSKIEHQTEIDYPYENCDYDFDVAIIENDNPILNIHVKDYKWDDSRRNGLLANENVCWTKETYSYYPLDIPLYVCLSSKRIEETIEFANLWGNREFNELYKLFPNKISTINYIR